MPGDFERSFETTSAVTAGLATTGSLKCTHRFWLLRFATLLEQLIVQGSVTQSINELPWDKPVSVLEDADLPAGDNVRGISALGHLREEPE